MERDAPAAVEGQRYTLPTGNVLEVQHVRPHARGYRVICIEMAKRDLFPGSRVIVVLPHERFCRLCGVQR